jgi:hypothetical protein
MNLTENNVTEDTARPALPEALAAREAAPRTRYPLGDLLLPASAARPLAA